MTTQEITADGKLYLVGKPHVGRFGTLRPDGGYDTHVAVEYYYHGTRNGKQFGPARWVRSTGTSGKVGKVLLAQAQRLYGADHDQMIADYLVREQEREAARNT